MAHAANLRNWARANHLHIAPRSPLKKTLQGLEAERETARSFIF
ncbi:hypothetical protein [Novosphingobium pokkalii]|uniref:Transposase n=1 Tax=Novosphingobium pokkalii TaxID=1770194 RepID=A0ABV7V6Q7_9SPHN|nr:hypothetical protein [Novosphingobium pokkalii]